MPTSFTFFESTSPSDEAPSVLTVSFAQDPSGILGAQLKNLDNGEPGEQFNPAYAIVDRLIHGDTVARKCGVIPGDCIVAVNGEGYRRFAPDYNDAEKDNIDVLTTNLDGSMSISFDGEGAESTADSKSSIDKGNANDDKEEKEDDESTKRLKYRVIPSGINGGEAYKALIREIKEIKSANDPENPLLLTLERYGWDSRVNSWPRFLAARNNNVPLAMKMIQEHEQWKSDAFPIELKRAGLQTILKSNAISEIEIQNVKTPATVYVDLGKLMAMEGTLATSKDILDSFVITTEVLLSKAADPMNPKICQFIDLSEASLKNTRVNIMKQVYGIFEPNYPETLHKMVIYPVTKAVWKTVRMLLGFVNEGTKQKIILTDNLDEVCKELGWYRPDIENCGGIAAFMKKHQKDNNSFIV
jgi:hypothetical protein